MIPAFNVLGVVVNWNPRMQNIPKLLNFTNDSLYSWDKIHTRVPLSVYLDGDTVGPDGGVAKLSLSQSFVIRKATTNTPSVFELESSS